MHLILVECHRSGGHALFPLLQHLGFQPPADGPYKRWLEATRPAGSGAAAGDTENESSELAQSPRTAHAELLAACDRPTLLDARDRLGMVEQLLAADQTAQVVVLYRRPERGLAAQLAAGTSPGEALALWNATATSLLGMIRRQRKRCLIVDIDQALHAPNLFLQACRERLNVKCKPWVSELTQEPPEQAVEPLHHVIAAQLLAQSGSTQALLGELEAAALALGDSAAAPVDCDAAWSSLARAEQQAKLAASLQAEVDNLSRQLQESNARPPAPLQPASDALKRELDDAKEENELLLAQLHQVQEELERYFLQSQSKAPAPAFYSSDAQAKLERMEKTLSWRITAPLRWGFRPFKRRLSKHR